VTVSGQESSFLLQVVDLTARLDLDSSCLLSKVCIRARRGETIGIVGESGSGKTTLLRAILGMVEPGIKLSGRILFESVDLLTVGERRMEALRGSRIGYVPQDPLAALNPCLTVGDQVTEGIRLHRSNSRGRRFQHLLEIFRGYGLALGRQAERNEAAALLGEVGIIDPESRVSCYPHQFSGGMRQRAIIAGSTAARPVLVLADEPTTALDASVERHVLDLLRDRTLADRSALILVTHDLNVAAWYCNYVYVMFQGRIVEHGDVDELFSGARHPYTRELLSATPGVPALPDWDLTEDVDVAAGPLPTGQGCPYRSRCERRVDVCSQEFPQATGSVRKTQVHCFNPVTGGK